MKRRAFQKLLSQIEKLTPNQEKQLQNQLNFIGNCPVQPSKQVSLIVKAVKGLNSRLYRSKGLLPLIQLER